MRFILLAFFLSGALAAQGQDAESFAALPEAPSALLAAGPQQPEPPPAKSASSGPANYLKPTAAENFRAYRREMIGPRPFIHAAIRSGIEQGRDVPTGWGQDFAGYAQRYGSAYGEAAIDTTVRYGLGAALHEDVRYLRCNDCDFGGKLKNAVLAEFTARHGADGHRIFSPTPIVASFSGPSVAYAAWYPPGYTESMAAKHALFGVGTRIAFHLLREYIGEF